MEKVPVTIVTGYLGSGKTTLLNNLLKYDYVNDNLALVINDVGSVNIDASLVKNEKNLKGFDVKELTNGCICCTLNKEFMAQIEELSSTRYVHKILVEASGVSNPLNLINGFDQYAKYFDINAKLVNIVTVVDSKLIYEEYFSSMEEYVSNNNRQPNILNLVINQIEFCNSIILNKCDLLTEEQIKLVEILIRKIQPSAKIFRTINSNIEPDKLFSSKEIDIDTVKNSSTYSKALLNEKNVVDEYGITSFTFTDKRPFIKDKFIDFVTKRFPQTIIRSKGYIWFYEESDNVKLFETASYCLNLSTTGKWLASFTNKNEVLKYKSDYDISKWDSVFGDRLNQIVFIGKDYDKEYILFELSKCLKNGK